MASLRRAAYELISEKFPLYAEFTGGAVIVVNTELLRVALS